MPEPGDPLIVVCGEALIDLFVEMPADAPMHATPRLGGAPFNLAIGLGRMQQSVAFCGGVSTDTFGEALYKHLIAEKVSGEFIERHAEPTMLVVIGRTADGRPTYEFPVKVSADRQLEGLAFAGQHAPVGTVVVGSHLLVLPETQARLLKVVKSIERETLICVDPNVRLGVIADERLWLDALEKFLPHADIVKASDEDVSALYPDAAIEDVAAAWRGKGARLVVITQGAGGATAWFGDGERLHVPGESVVVADTVGAGDGFFAALLARLNEEDVLVKTGLDNLRAELLAAALRFAVAAASITCARVGADLPNRQTVAAHLDRDGSSILMRVK